MAEKGYQATTIADIARVARVSRTVARTQQEARAAGLPWRERTRAVIGAYLEALAAGPAVAWAAVVEVQAAGRSALELRRTVIDRYVDLLTGAAAELADLHPDEVRPVDRALLLAAVGGNNELLLARVERGEADRLAEDADSATAVVVGLLERRR
jgi:AcrR family transcriptional regulator